jgi:hypothetical protein
MPGIIQKLAMVALLLSLPMLAQSPPSRKTDDKKSKPCREPAPGRLSLADVAYLLNTPEKGCVVEYVQKRGVRFGGDQQILEMLKALGASDELLKLIPAPPPLPPPPPPLPKVSGPLTIACQPSKCEVIVNDHYYGVTEDGPRVIKDIPAGMASIQVRSDGFEPEMRSVNLPEGSSHGENFVLRPTLTLRRQRGYSLLVRVVSAFGGVEGLAAISEMSGVGTAALPDEDQQLREWEMRFVGRQGWPSMRFLSSQVECEAPASADVPTATCEGKPKKAKLEATRKAKLEATTAKAAELFRDSQFATLLARLLTRAVIESDSEVRKIETEGGPDSFLLSLDDQGLPTEIVYRAKPDAEPLTIRYSKYLMENRLRYPGRIEVLESPNEKPLAVFTIGSVPIPTPAPPPGKKRP